MRFRNIIIIMSLAFWAVGCCARVYYVGKGRMYPALLPLHKAVAKGDTKHMDKLLNSKCDVNLKDSLGNTPLHIAVYYGQKKAAKQLIKRGADYKIKNIAGRTPAELGQTRKVEELVASCARCLDNQADWVDRDKGLEIYQVLKDMDIGMVISALVYRIYTPENRLQSLFLAVKLGIPGTEELLVSVLMSVGDEGMAEDYLNSGSSALADGAKRWAAQNGYSIKTGLGSHRAAWGEF